MLSIRQKKTNLKLKEDEIEDSLNTEDAETVVVTGIMKNCFRGFFLYHEFNMNFNGMTLNPVDYEKFELARFQIENNLPIKKEILYQLCPDLFYKEIQDEMESVRDNIISERIQWIEVNIYIPIAFESKRLK